VEIVPDGTRVEAGQEVARFEFQHLAALPWLKKALAEAEAELETARAQSSEGLRSKNFAATLATMTRQKAELDVGKEGLVSERDLSILKLASARAEEEESVAMRLAEAAAVQQKVDLALYQARVADWKLQLARYKQYVEKTRSLAPHAGWVRYGYLNHAHRKLQKPDDMPSGTPFAYIATSESLSIEFYVPEQRAAGLAIDKAMAVRLPDEEKRTPITIRAIGVFPQEMGFLRGDDELPDAREKGWGAIADVESPPPALKSGVEVRVEP
jgi:multidrug resistance efflux pump